MEYTADNIKILSDIAHVKKRKGMYIGDADNPYQLFSEILDNAVDESGAGYGDKIIVKINTKKNEYLIRDFGRGIPHGKKVLESGEEKEIVEILLTKLNSGGKFDHEGYKRSAGLHGVGSTVTNALSSRMEVETIRDGKSVKIIMVNSEKESLTYSDSDQPSGTEVKFIPDPQYFSIDVIPYYDILNRCKILNAFGIKVELYKDEILEDLSGNPDIFSLMPNQDKIYCRDLFRYTSENDEEIIVAFQYSPNTKFNSIGYSNYLYNRLGGNHCARVRDAICDVWKEFTDGNTEVNLHYDDCTLGLDVLTAVFIEELSFSAQVKDKLNTPKWYFDKLIEGFKELFRKYLTENDKIREGLIKRFVEYRLSQNKLLSQKEIMSLIKLNEPSDNHKIKRKSVVANLYECTSDSVDDTEEFIVEGNSAAGGPGRTRDRRTQAVLPLRGKIQNITYMSPKDALKHETVRNIVNSTGCGVIPNCDPKRSRYERYIILTDADPDGKHITALVLSVFVNLMPDLIKAGMVYVLKAPLYGYTYDKKKYYTNNYDDIPKECITNKKFTRYKGLGEMKDDDFKVACMNKENRYLYRVEYPDNVDKFNEILGTSWGRANLLRDLGIIKNVSSNSEIICESESLETL